MDKNNKIYEGVKKIQLKRKYTDNHPAVTVGKNAKVRNPVLGFIETNKPNKVQLDNFMQKNGISKTWMSKNVSYFEEDGGGLMGLTPKGKKVLSGINEADAEFDVEDLGTDAIEKLLKFLKDNNISFEYEHEDGDFSLDIEDYDDIEGDIKSKLDTLLGDADLLGVVDEEDDDFEDYEDCDESDNADGDLITEKIVRKWKIKDGKKVKVKKTDKAGYKMVDGKEKKMSSEEKRTRKKAAKKMKKTKKRTFKGAAKAKSDKKRKKNAKIRKRLIRDNVNESEFMSFNTFSEITEADYVYEAAMSMDAKKAEDADFLAYLEENDITMVKKLGTSDEFYQFQANESKTLAEMISKFWGVE